MRFNKRLSLIGIFMALVFAMFAIVPVSAADSSISLSPSTFIAPDVPDATPNPGEPGEVTVTVTDTDENVSMPVSNEVLGGSITTLASGLSATFFLNNSNVIAGTLSLDDTAGGQDESDPLILEVVLGSSVQGRIVITAGAADYTGALNAVTIDYEYASTNTVDVDVDSTVGLSAGITIQLTETGVDTGVFDGTFFVGKGNTAGEVDLDETSDGAGDGIITGMAGLQEGIITVSYMDNDDSADTSSVTIDVEDTFPTVAEESPADDARTTDLTPTLYAEVTDIESGVVEGSIAIVLDSVNPDTGDAAAVGSLTTAAIGNGFSVTADLSNVDADVTVTITWHITADDAAGNAASSTVMTLVVDQEDPTLSSAETGVWWDTSIIADDKTNSTATDALTTSIAVTFSEALDGATVAATDFEVDDVEPETAIVYDDAATIVFLTVPAQDADATPEVELVGAVSDVAGNTANSGTDAAATDGIAPTVTFTVSAALSDGSVDVVLDFAVDEPVGTPTVTRNSAGLSGSNGPQVVSVPANSYRVTHVDPNDGAYAIVITVSDGTTPSVVVGTNDALTSDIVYEVDSSVAAPTSTPADEASIAEAEPLFVTLTYTDEGAEYGLDVNAMPTNVIADVVTDEDTNNTVTITAATLDDVDVLTSLSTDNDILMEFALSGVDTGDHTLSVTAEDEAGNELTTVVDFTVTARADYTVSVNAGWNLISFPADPDDTSIDSVISSTHPATEVLTYDPNDANGPWLVAVRDSDNSWTGTLTTIDSSHAYWVNTGSSVDIAALLALRSQGATLLPTIAVSTGWNLLPMVDLTQAAVGTDTNNVDAWEHDALDYFATIDWELAYAFVNGAWMRVTASSPCADGDGTPDSDAGCLVNGRGYWVWVASSGTLVP